MHDVLEGSAPFFLGKFFEFLVSNRICTEAQCINKCIYYDYGYSHRLFTPTDLRIKSRNLGQNASQIYCLITHIPFIFQDHIDEPKLQQIWHCLQYLLKSMSIIFSKSIRVTDIEILRDVITNHLSPIRLIFKTNLLPKHHLHLHYAKCIEEVGPIVHLSTMMYEQKHKVLKNIAKRSPNFINLSKSLAERYQRSIIFDEPYKNTIASAKVYSINMNDFDYLDIIEKDNIDVNELGETKWLRINGITYRKFVFVLFRSKFFEISAVFLKNDNSQFFFLCTEYGIKSFSEFFNSYEIEMKLPIAQFLIAEADLILKKTFSVRRIGERSFIYKDTCEMLPII